MSGFDTISDGSAQYRCTACLKAFKNLCHLRRHEVIHTRDLSHQCQFCSKLFGRSDALRRHFKTCPKIGQQDSIPVASRGRRSRACERCRHKKLRCDGNQPCKRCMSVSATCFSLSGHDKDNDASRVSMKFMLNYTDPAFESVSDAYAVSEAYAVPSEQYSSFSHSTGLLDDELLADLFSGIFTDDDADGRMESTSRVQPFTMTLPAPMAEQRTSALVALLKAQHDSKPNAPSFPEGIFPVEVAKSVFTAKNQAEYITAFFHFFHPHTPFVHRPSFDASKVSLELLLAVFLVGSVFCTPRDDALSARYFFDVAEEYVFKRLQDIVLYNEKPVNSGSIEIVQAAVLIHAIQVNSNHGDIRFRFRMNRMPQIIAALRRLDLFQTVRSKSVGDQTWDQFIFDEVRIRLAYRVFTTDCMETLLFKSPPRITIAEMCGELPSTDAMFDASDSTEYQQLLATVSNLKAHHWKLMDLMNVFLGEAWPKSSSDWSSIEAEHLMIIMFALHSTIFVSRTGLSMPSTRQTLMRAADRWKELWQEIRCRSGVEIPIVGVAKYALELWWLAQKILEVAQRDSQQTSYLTGTPTNMLIELHDFIQKYRCKV